MLDSNFPQYRIRENYRPDWLVSSGGARLELDFYIEDLKIAFEVQGDQHFAFIPFFHKTEEDFEKRKQYDQVKRDLCYGQGVKLIEICTETDAHIAVKDIQERHCEQPKYSYSYEELEPRGKRGKEQSRKLLSSVRNARRAINKGGNPQVLRKRMNRLLQMCQSDGFQLSDPLILEYIEKNL